MSAWMIAPAYALVGIVGLIVAVRDGGIKIDASNDVEAGAIAVLSAAVWPIVLAIYLLSALGRQVQR